MTLSSELCRTQHGRAQTAKRASYVGSGCCRTYLGGGVWEARCKFRDTDGTNVGFFLETYAHVLKNDDRDAAEQAASFPIGGGWDPESDDKQG